MYQLFSPPEHLQNVVRYYWLLDLSSSRNNLTEYIFAYPYVNWVFTLGIPYTVRDGLCGDLVIKDTRILGPRTNFAEYVHPEGNLAFGVTFQFGGTLPIFKEETRLLTNKILLQDDILPSSGWLTPFFNEVAIDTFITTLNHEIEKSTRDGHKSGYVLWTRFLELITGKGHYMTPVRSLTKELKISQRQLQRVTMQYAGLSPKQIQSMIRCRLAVRHIQKTGIVTDFFQYGYYDQNHFIKEVKKWSGRTPNVLIPLLRPIMKQCF